MATNYKRGDTVESKQWKGVALWVIEPVIDEHDNVIVRMVGDDRDFEAYAPSLRPLEADEFCGGCGQIGCAHGQ